MAQRTDRYRTFIMSRVSLFKSNIGFFGRTYEGKRIELNRNLEPVNGQDSDFVILLSKYNDKDIIAVIELVFIVQDIQLEDEAANKDDEEEKKDGSAEK